MRILDENNIKLTEEQINLELGYLRPESIISIHHEAIEETKEVGHYEVIAEYPNGGKDVKWVIDVPGVEAKEAWDEYEDIQRYVLYTEEQLAAKEAERKAKEEDALLKVQLRQFAENAVTWDELAARMSKWFGRDFSQQGALDAV